MVWWLICDINKNTQTHHVHKKKLTRTATLYPPRKNDPNSHHTTRHTPGMNRQTNPKLHTQTTAMLWTSSRVNRSFGNIIDTAATRSECLSYTLLKLQGSILIRVLTYIFNLSIKKISLPNQWKTNIIITLWKPNKSPANSHSYRPTKSKFYT